MKISKSLLVTLSCSAIGGSLAVGIALSIGVPSIAETVKESQIKLEPTGIDNKDYRNKQSTPSIVGSWKSGVEDNEYRQTDPLEINLDIKSDGSTTYAFRSKSGDNFQNNAYKYSYANEGTGTLVQELSYGSTTVSSIKWISENEFIQTLISDSRDPHRNGIQRRYIRQQEPVATILQQQAQKASATQQDALRRARTEGQLRAVPYQNRVLIDTFRSY